MKNLTIVLFLLCIFSSALAQETDNSKMYETGLLYADMKYDDNLKLHGALHSPKKPGRLVVKANNRNKIRRDSQKRLLEELLLFDDDTLVTVIAEKEGDNGMIKSYTWNSEGNELAIIKGEIGKSDLLEGNEIWIYNAEKQKLISVITNTKDLYLTDIKWAEFDGYFYVKSLAVPREVYRVDIENKELIPTGYHATNFSPDGKFYYDDLGGGEAGRLYRREANELIWSNYPEKPFFNRFQKWDKNEKGETLLHIKGNRASGVLNCETLELDYFKYP